MMIPTPITREAALALLQQFSMRGDEERAHYEADKILEKIIREVLGWDDVVEAYQRIGKWYA